MAAGALLRRRWLRGTILVALIGLTGGCSYRPDVRGPFRGRVLDAETGKPLPDAVVVAAWSHVNPLVRLDYTNYDAQEAVTDAQGHFELSGLQGFIGWHNVERPRFYVFAAGYGLGETQITPANGREFLDPTVQFMRLLATRAERCAELDATNSAVIEVPHEKMRRFIEARTLESRTLKCGAREEQQ